MRNELCPEFSIPERKNACQVSDEKTNISYSCVHNNNNMYVFVCKKRKTKKKKMVNNETKFN